MFVKSINVRFYLYNEIIISNSGGKTKSIKYLCLNLPPDDLTLSIYKLLQGDRDVSN